MNPLRYRQKFYMSCVIWLAVSPMLYASGEDEKITAINPSMSFYLNETQIMANTRAALTGDAGAAFKNYQYCNFVVPQGQLSARWLLVAVLSGHPVAMRNWSYLCGRHLLTRQQFIYSPAELKHQVALVNTSWSTIDCYWLYLHYVATGNQEKSAAYQELLQKQKVSEYLLGEAVAKRLQTLDVSPK